MPRLLATETRGRNAGEALFSISKNSTLWGGIISANPFLIPGMVEEFGLWECQSIAGGIQEQVLVRVIVGELERAKHGAPLRRGCEDGSWAEASTIVVNKVLGIINWPWACACKVGLQCYCWLRICTTATRLGHSFWASHGVLELWNLECRQSMYKTSCFDVSSNDHIVKVT